MIDMLQTIVPRSDQLNADDLIGGKTITIKITDITGTGGDQPVSVHFDGDNGKPYKPCKSMRRVMVKVWGPKAHNYIGRSMTLFCDDKVKYGGAEVGGIRISHMSHLDKEMTIALTVTKANRKPYTVKPLLQTSADASTVTDFDDIKVEAREAADRGTAVLQALWTRLKPQQQKALLPLMDGFKLIAAAVDDTPPDLTAAG